MYLYREILDTPLGQVIAIANNDGLCFLGFGDTRGIDKEQRMLAHAIGGDIMDGEHPFLRQTWHELGEYLEQKRQVFEVPLNVHGTPFQRQVWQLLQQIPYGEVWSYQEMAQKLGRPTAMRAVASANSHNPISIIIPCHRVIGKKGDLVGYSGGLWRKEKLLLLERQNTEDELPL